jgi:hypothetical protein
MEKMVFSLLMTSHFLVVLAVASPAHAQARSAVLPAAASAQVVATPAESSFELSCRAKAKEVAADTYRTCVVESRGVEIDKLKKDYQERLRSLKEDYEKDIDKLGAKQKTSRKNDSAKFVASANRPVKKNPYLDSDTLAAMNSSSQMERAEGTRDASADDSKMDIPEPIPVEKMSAGK